MTPSAAASLYIVDMDAALFVLNKQRLRLTGSPTENDRRDVAKQLAGWKRSYLR